MLLLLLFFFVILVQGYKNITLMKNYANNIRKINMMLVNTDGSTRLYKKGNVWRYDYFYRLVQNINYENPVKTNIAMLFTEWDEPILLSNTCPFLNTSWDFHMKNHYVSIDPATKDQLVSISTGSTPDCHLDIPVPYVAMSDNYLKININNIPSWEKKIPLLFWRGSITGGNTLEKNHRYKAVKFLSQFEWQDVKFHSTHPHKELPNNESSILVGQEVKLDYMCRFKYILNIAGYTHAYRLHMLTKCKSVIISLSPILDLIDNAMYPYYYRISSETEIPAIMEYLLHHDLEAKMMAENMNQQVKTKITSHNMKIYSQHLLRKLENYEYKR